MFQTKKIYVTGEKKMADLIIDNPALLLMIEHLEGSIVVQNKTVEQYCNENNLSSNVFIVLANLFNGFSVKPNHHFNNTEIDTIINYLSNSHKYYKSEKYPEIKYLIEQLGKQNDSAEIKLVEQFFNDYFSEVIEHLNYEEKTAFPYFKTILQKSTKQKADSISAHEYSEHHSDVESKLSELRDLLMKHIPLKNDKVLRRKLLLSLFELEANLTIHQLIEDLIVVPTINEREKNKKHE